MFLLLLFLYIFVIALGIKELQRQCKNSFYGITPYVKKEFPIKLIKLLGIQKAFSFCHNRFKKPNRLKKGKRIICKHSQLNLLTPTL